MKIILAIIWLITTLFIASILADVVDRYVITNLAYYQPMFIGFILYIVSLFIISHRRYQFMNTFFHELSHLIFALLIFARPKKMVVTSASSGRAGYVGYEIAPFLKGYM